MRQLVIGIGLVVCTAACASPWARKKRPVVRQAPRVVVLAPTSAETAGATTNTPADGMYEGTYPMVGGGSGATAPAAGGGTSNPNYGDYTTSPAGPGAYTGSGSAFERNPVPGSVREYINRYGNGGAMAK